MSKIAIKTFMSLVFISGGLIFSGCITINNSSNADNKNSAANKSISNSVVSKEQTNSTVEAAKSPTATPDTAQRQKTIDTYIAGVAKVSQASEYEKARIVKYGDIDGDGDEDAVAQFTLEGVGGGGNNYSFELAVFRNDDGKFTGVTDDVVGGKLNRDVELTKVADGKIYLDTKAYAKDDGACCPSIAGKTVYILKNDKLVEEKNNK